MDPITTRRRHMQGLPAMLASGLASEQARAAANAAVAYGRTTLPAGIRSRFVNNGNGLKVHLLESGFETPKRPLVLLLHGFPDLAYCWRKTMLPLAAAGYHVVSPDLRGYGQTTGWNGAYDGDLAPFSMHNMVKDTVDLVFALGHRSIPAIVGHDAGSPLSAWCALIRPEVFHSVVLMSAPFAGPPAVGAAAPPSIDGPLAALARPRKYYQSYYATREADGNMRNAPQGLKAFLRAYFHYKSADWAGNQPFPLKARTADELAKMPTYYVMDLDQGMAETVAAHMPSAAEIAACRWLTGEELDVYVSEFRRTGFQGGLQFYRRASDVKSTSLLLAYSGRTIDVPSLFISGKSDWGTYQTPGAAEKMRSTACTRMAGFHLVDGAGHWVQQEQPDKVNRLLLEFLGRG